MISSPFTRYEVILQKKLRRMSDSVIKVTDHTSPTEYKDHYNPAHPIASTQVVQKNPNNRRANKPKKDGQNKQCSFSLWAI
jgi:hypothetical protein